jgi:hypothetical protein
MTTWFSKTKGVLLNSIESDFHVYLLHKREREEAQKIKEKIFQNITSLNKRFHVDKHDLDYLEGIEKVMEEITEKEMKND